MKIAEVSKRYDITADTLRYYERIGLLRPVPRNKSGIRDYNEASCQEVEFIKCMRNAGMSIESLVEYMSLLKQGEKSVDQRKALLEKQLGRIDERIAELQQARERLEYRIEHYEESIAPCENAMGSVVEDSNA